MRIMNGKDAAAFLGMSRFTLRKLIDSGEGPEFYLPPPGRRPRFKEEDLLAWLERYRVGADPPPDDPVQEVAIAAEG